MPGSLDKENVLRRKQGFYHGKSLFGIGNAENVITPETALSINMDVFPLLAHEKNNVTTKRFFKETLMPNRTLPTQFTHGSEDGYDALLSLLLYCKKIVQRNRKRSWVRVVGLIDEQSAPLSKEDDSPALRRCHCTDPSDKLFQRLFERNTQSESKGSSIGMLDAEKRHGTVENFSKNIVTNDNCGSIPSKRDSA
jgi:hypothetical protein